MAAEETYTREELEGRSRLALRRSCKRLGMSSEDCAKMDFEEMVDWLMEQQDGGGSKKSSAKKPPAGKKKAPARSTKKGAPRKAKKPEPEEEPEAEETGEVGGDELLNALMTKLGELEEKIDTLGEITDKNVGQLSEDMNDMRADVYGVVRRQQHFHAWMVAEGNLSTDEAPDGTDFDALEEVIEAECSGNEEGE